MIAGDYSWRVDKGVGFRSEITGLSACLMGEHLSDVCHKLHGNQESLALLAGQKYACAQHTHV